MTLQYRDVEGGYIEWREYLVDGERMLSPADIDALPAGVYRLRICWTIKSITVAVTIAARSCDGTDHSFSLYWGALN